MVDLDVGLTGPVVETCVQQNVQKRLNKHVFEIRIYVSKDFDMCR